MVLHRMDAGGHGCKLQRQLLKWIGQRGKDNAALFLNDKQETISIRGITKGLIQQNLPAYVVYRTTKDH